MTLFDFELAGVEGSPDGMTIDVDGNLWVASVFGSRVIKVDGNTGELLQQVRAKKLSRQKKISFSHHQFGNPKHIKFK